MKTILLLCTFLAMCTSYGLAVYDYEREILLAITKNYDKNEIPKEPTRVLVYIKILGLELDSSQESVTVTMYFRQRWTDPRLAWRNNPRYQDYYNDIFAPSLAMSIWVPDVYFVNGLKGYVHTMTKPNFLLRLNSEGTILYSQKITMRLSCPMNDKRNYPMDKLSCPMIISSYSYSKSQLQFFWRTEYNAAIVVSSSLSPVVDNFLDPVKVKAIDGNNKSNLVSQIEARFDFGQRSIGAYSYSVYLPSSLALFMAWTAFWIDRDALVSRALLVGVPFAIVAKAAASCYAANALGCWLAFCLCLLAFQLHLLVGLNFLEKRQQQATESTGENASFLSGLKVSVLEIAVGIVSVPLLFLLFNIIYWSYYAA